MAHYAFLDDNNIVTEVIAGIDEGGEHDWEVKYGEMRSQTCKRTSYNTVKGVHKLGGTPFRGNYAGLGYYYNETLDAFIPPKPYESWVLNTTTFVYDPPSACPGDLIDYRWDESTTSWVLR